MASRRGRGRARYAARLGCGTVLTYDSESLTPEVGENVPCPRHYYCAVAARHRLGTGRSGTSQAPPRRSTSELAEFLRPRQVSTVAVLRRNRFTLRVVVAAQKEGLVEVDLVSGRVALLSEPHPATGETG